MKKYILLFCSFVIITITSCRKDAVIDTMTTEVLDETMFNGSVIGTVVDQLDQPIENALITVGGKSEMTDQNGTFVITEVGLTNFGKYVSATKSGYFHGGKNIFANAEGTYRTKISLVENAPVADFSATDGVTYEISGAKIQIPENSISLNGTPYFGTVNLSTTWLDPTQDETYDVMPGNLTALNGDNELQTLLSFGMIGVDLYSPDGDKLQLTEGTTANLTFPIPQSLQSAAEQTIDLWHFDETSGKWLLEGQANLEGNNYVAEVGHFSWWNCDVASEITSFCVNFVDRFGNPVVVQNAELVLSSDNFGVASAYISSASVYCNLVPQGEIFLLQLLTACGDVIVAQTVGPFSDAEEEITIQVNEDLPFNVLNFSGTISDCMGDPVSNGFIQLTSDENQAFDLTNGNGMYNLNIIDCGNTTNVSVYGVDIENLLEDVEEVPVVAGTNEYVVNLEACNEVTVGTSFFQYFSPNGPVNSDICDARVTAAETLIISDNILLGINGFGTGTFNGNLIAANTTTNDLNLTTIEITVFGEVGENIAGTFSNPEGSGSFVATRIQ